jgi:hypothetical protein
MYCFRENSNFPFSNQKIITLVVCLYICLIIYTVFLISFIKCNCSNMEEIKIINQSYTRARDLTIVCYTEIAIQIS